jgi:hypothetical protein
MPRNDPNDLRPPMKYKERQVARPLSKREVTAAADRAEARAVRTQLADNQAQSNGTKPRWEC